MDHPAFVRGGERGAKFVSYLNSFPGRQSADSPQQRAKGFAIYIFHRQESNPVRLRQVVHATDVRMRDFAGQANLVVQPVQRPCISG